MKRFLMLVGVAVVAAAMYVAAGSASQQAKGPTLKQFNALKKQVTALSKRLKTDENDLNLLAFVYVHCSLPSTIQIEQRSGYQNSAPPDTALDLGNINPAWTLTPFNTTDSGCVQLVGAAPMRRHSASVIAQKFARSH